MRFHIKVFLLLSLLFIFNKIFSQCNGRYETEIFSTVSVQTINYSDVYTDTEHEMDVYIPDGDAVTDRPLIVFCHGGSFMNGDKLDSDCVDFCESFAKRGYVTASVNYRQVANDFISQGIFVANQQEQYKQVMKAVADAKAAIRYFRKDFLNGNTFGIDGNTVYIGGASAGAVLALHLAFLDDVSDLPTSPFNIQDVVNDLGGLEGDAGNNGYSSSVNGVISIAGGINDVNWIDASDDPLVSVQGDADDVVSYNCAPGLGFPTVVTLCGSGEMHPQANLVGIPNDVLVYPGEAHTWFPGGSSNPKFVQALDFIANFLFPILPCNNTSVFEMNGNGSKLNRVVDVLGRPSKIKANTPLYFIYENGVVEKKMIIE